MTATETTSLVILCARLMRAFWDLITAEASNDRSPPPELLAEVARLAESISAIPALHAAQQAELRRAAGQS
jgi:hypothetical protein